MSDAIREMAEQYGSNVEIVAGPHKETFMPANMKKYTSDVRTLDGKEV